MAAPAPPRLRAFLLAILASLGAIARADDLYGEIAAAAAAIGSADPAQRRRAVDQLGGARPEEAGPLLQKALEDPDAEVRARAAAAIARLRVAGAEAALLGHLSDPDPRVRSACAEALGRVPHPEAGAAAGRVAPALARALTDGESEVRRAAVIALARLGPVDPEGARAQEPALLARLDDESPGVRRAAVEAVARLHDDLAPPSATAGAAIPSTNAPGSAPDRPRAVVPLIGRLADSSREVRAAALDALAAIGDPRAAPAMLRMLRDPADDVRDAATTALGRLGAPTVLQSLVALLGRPIGGDGKRGRAAIAIGRVLAAMPRAEAGGATTGEVRRAIDALIGYLARDPSGAREVLTRLGALVVPRLVEQLDPGPVGGLGAPPEPAVGVVVDLLGGLGDPRAIPALVAELTRGRVAPERTIDALGRCLRGQAEPDPLALSALLARLRDDAVVVRRRAAAALDGIADARAGHAFVQALGDPDPEVRRIAIEQLGRLRVGAAVPQLAEALASPDSETQPVAARALGRIGDARALPALIGATVAENRELRRAAADALTAFDGTARKAAVPSLIAALRGARGAARADATAALGALLRGLPPDPLARDRLLDEAGSGELARAQAALDALGATGDRSVVGAVRRLLASGPPARRRHAARALGDLGDPGARPALEAALADPEPSVRAEAAWALGKLPATTVAERERAIAALLPSLHAREAPTRAAALAALHRLDALDAQGSGAARLVDALPRLLTDRDPAVRANASALAARRPALRPRVAALIDEDPEPIARAAALLALSRATPSAKALARAARQEPSPSLRALAAALLVHPAPAAAPRSQWLRAQVLDYDGEPRPSATCRLQLADGLVKVGFTDAAGWIREEHVPDGAADLSLPPD